MTKTSKLSMIVLLLCLSVCLIHVPSVFASSENLYVNSFSATVNGWVHTGSSPWLDNSNSYSSSYTNHANDSAYGFADTTVSDFSTITSIKLKGEAQTNNELNYAVLVLYGSNSGSWSSSTSVFGDGTTSFISFESLELKTTVNSLARINEALLNLTKHNTGGAGTLTLRRVYLAIVFTAPSVNYTLTTAVSPSGSGSVSPSGSNSYVQNTNVSISATANPGYVLSYWLRNNTLVGTNGTSPYVCNMTANYNVTAVFTPASQTFNFFSSIPFGFDVSAKKNASFSRSAVIPFSYLTSSSRAVLFQQNSIMPFQFFESSGKAVLFNPFSSIPLSFGLDFSSNLVISADWALALGGLAFIFGLCGFSTSLTKRKNILPLGLIGLVLGIFALAFMLLDVSDETLRLSMGTLGLIMGLLSIGLSFPAQGRQHT